MCSLENEMSVFDKMFLLGGILGSGFALKVQQKQRQKHFNRQIPAAATLIQCLWRCYAADNKHVFNATWRIHVQDKHTNTLKNVARRASLMRRRKFSKPKLDLSGLNNHIGNHPVLERKDSESSMVFYAEEPNKQASPSRKKSVVQAPNLEKYSDKLYSSMNEGDDIPDGDYTNYFGEHCQKPVQLTEAHKTAIRVIRRIRYFVARRKFQQARKPYDVRDVIEQYSQGHLNMMVRIKELQRRLDQTLGKPGVWSMSSDKDKQKQTLCARMIRVESQVNKMDQKLDQALFLLNTLVKQRQQINEDSKEDQV
ncbi:unnamed protein product [Owenia fusiformis]|uniref:Potassium channel voltage dependent KCNQ C-terminal domain-containing protein n=1 Tax=Owenia fusiformis TaxID=6347 RepID=A0A8S4Q353_OWEFU|nr:unnamed protein product [Owenia fusiformis]